MKLNKLKILILSVMLLYSSSAKADTDKECLKKSADQYLNLIWPWIT